MASCAAAPPSPFSIARSESDNFTIPETPGSTTPTIIPRMTRFRHLLPVTLLAAAVSVAVSTVRSAQQTGSSTILRPARVFDGETTHEGWAVRVKGDRIDEVGPAAAVAAGGAR